MEQTSTAETTAEASLGSFGGEGLFVRKSSGLVREIGVRDAFYLASNCASLPGNLALGLLSVLALYPGSDPAITAIIVGAQSIVLALMYAFLVGAMPRSGGDYVYVGRATRPVIGAAVGVGILLLVALTICQIAFYITGTYLSPAIILLGHALGGNWNTFATNVSTTHLGQIISGSLLIGLAALVTLASNKAVRLTLFVGFLMGAVGTVIILFLALTHGTGSFASAFNHAAGNPHAYDQVIATARHQGASFGTTFSGVLSAAPLLALFFYGFASSNFAAGELKRPSLTYRLATIGAVIFFALSFAVTWWAMKGMAGSDFMHAAANLSQNDAATYSKIAGGASVSATTQYFTSLVAGNGFTQAAPAVLYVIGYATLMVAEFFIFSRLAFAMAFDRLLPSKVADVSARGHVPVKAVALGTALALVFLVFAVFTATFLSLLLVLAIIGLAQLTITSIVATFLPWLRPGLYESAPKLFSGTWLGIPTITIIGGISAITNGIFLYLGVTQAQISGGWGVNRIVTFVVIAFSGVVVYGISKFVLARRGVDLALAMHELPPE